jgi:transketolase
MAEIAVALWQRHLVHNPANPNWANRDRFVISNGHGSMLLYALLHLTGYDLPMEEIKRFRQLHSKTPGHPERGITPGVETTTGPLGQGLANAIGMAIAERLLAASFNRPGHDIVDHRTYAIVSDGDLQEGVASEASSLAGHLRLGKLIALYDDNHIQLDGPTAWAFTEDVVGRFAAYGWHTQRVDWTRTGEYVEDVQELYTALLAAKAETSKPSIISLRTIIGFPAPKKQNTGKIHGSALGAEEVAGLKEVLGFDPAKSFDVDQEVLAHARSVVDRGAAAHKEWEESFNAWQAANPQGAALLQRIESKELPDGVDAALAAFAVEPPESPLSAERHWIDECYTGETALDVVAALRAHGSGPAEDAANLIAGRSPIAVAVTMAAVRRAATLDTLEDVLRQEFRTACTALRSRSGPPTHSASASSATSTVGTGAWCRCARSAAPAFGRSSCPASARACSTNSSSRPKTAPCG